MEKGGNEKGSIWGVGGKKKIGKKESKSGQDTKRRTGQVNRELVPGGGRNVKKRDKIDDGAKKTQLSHSVDHREERLGSLLRTFGGGGNVPRKIASKTRRSGGLIKGRP